MFSNLALGVYHPGEGLLHRLRARTKLLLMLWLVVYLTLANRHMWHFVPYHVALVLAGCAIRLSGVPPGVLARRMWLPLLPAAFGVVPALMFTVGRTLHAYGPWHVPYPTARLVLIAGLAIPAAYLALAKSSVGVRGSRWFRRARVPVGLLAVGEGVGLWLVWGERGSLAVGPVVVTYDGVWLLMALLVYFPVLFCLALLLTMTTTPVALIEGMSLLLSPLRRVGLPVDEFALMVLIALRFVPTLADEAEWLVRAQSARGADFASGGARERLGSLTALIVPLIQGTMRSASELAVALESRGYGSGSRRTLLHEGPLSREDYLALGAVLAVTIASLLP